MSAVQYNVKIEASATFILSIIWKGPSQTPYDLTGYEGRFQLRPGVGGTATVTADSSNIGTTPGTTVEVGTTDGSVVVTLSEAVTQGLQPSPAQNWMYGLSVKAPDGTITRLIEGAAKVIPGVVQWP